MAKSSTKIKMISLSLLWFFTALSAVAVYFASRIPADYSMDQFAPKRHPLLIRDKESKKVFQISESSPHIVLLSFKKGSAKKWYGDQQLKGLAHLSEKIDLLKNVKSVISLGNIPSSFEQKKSLTVGSLWELKKQGLKTEHIQNDPLYTPNLISEDGLHTALYVIPESLSQAQHKKLVGQLKTLSQKAFPNAQVQIGGPAAIRTELVDLLAREIMLFILLSLLCSVLILKIMFHGYAVIAHVLFILIVANLLALGTMGWFGLGFNILSATVPIIVTVSSLGICTHLLVRMSEAAHKNFEERVGFLRNLIQEILVTVVLTTLSTSVGFATLIPSDVPLISDYGLAVALGVMVSGTASLILLPSLYIWLKWPVPRDFLMEPKRFAFFLVRHAKVIVPVMGLLTVAFAIAGLKLKWTAKLFDDLPQRYSANRTTNFISYKLGGVAPVDFMIGSETFKEPWKRPQNLEKLNQIASDLRQRKDVGSVLTAADFLSAGANNSLPKTSSSVAELMFLYSMSGESPLTQFISSNNQWTRVAVRLPDLPANRNQALIQQIKKQLQERFPGMTVKTSGMAAVLPVVNNELAKRLMWGFFEALFGIVLVLTFFFRSLRWALVGIVPNLVPPAVLLGFLAYFDVPMKPGIAIIFSISLGIAFDNTIYILGRLKHMLGDTPNRSQLPVYTLMKKETMPCLVSSLCLFAGFAIFLFSAFPVNKIFGLFVLLSIVAGILGDLVWLPAILKRYPWLLLEDRSRERLSFNPFSFEVNAVKISSYLILIALGLVAFRSAYASDVNQILKSVEERAAPPNERVDLKMIIQDADGSKKERQLTILRKNEGHEPRALVRLQKPADLKGLSLLTIAGKGKEEQWLYLPSDKKSRRILGSNKKGKFLDSEIAFEDLQISTYKEFTNKVVKDDGKLVQIESKAKPKSESSYGRIMTWISKKDFKIEKVDYYDLEGKLLKRAQFKDYQKVGEKFWRAKNVLVHNVQANRKTNLVVQNVSVKKIANDEISLSALED